MPDLVGYPTSKGDVGSFGLLELLWFQVQEWAFIVEQLSFYGDIVHDILVEEGHETGGHGDRGPKTGVSFGEVG